MKRSYLNVHKAKTTKNDHINTRLFEYFYFPVSCRREAMSELDGVMKLVFYELLRSFSEPHCVSGNPSSVVPAGFIKK